MRRVFAKPLIASMLVLTLLFTVALPWESIPAKAAGVSPAIDQVVQQVLINIRDNAWNSQAQSDGVTTGGLYINWKMDNPRVTNAGNSSTSHDPQVDLYYLNALAEYQTLHAQDHTYDGESQRALAQVTLDFNNYNVPKGWIYFYLLRDGLLLHNSGLINEAYQAAVNFYNNWYDPRVGIVYNRAHSPGNYAVDHTLECGSALIDAGLRWSRPQWVQAGQSTITNALTAALSPRYHLLYENISVSSSGVQSVANYQAKAATQGAAATALITAYNLTHNSFYLTIAGSLLQNMLNGPLWDSANGGLFFALDMDTGRIEQKYKETRGQTLPLIALYHYNQVFGNGQSLDADKQQQLINLLSNNFYQSTFHGYFYRVTPTFQIYTTPPGQGIGYENYFTTEAMGTAMDALQQTEFVSLPA